MTMIMYPIGGQLVILQTKQYLNKMTVGIGLQFGQKMMGHFGKVRNEGMKEYKVAMT